MAGLITENREMEREGRVDRLSLRRARARKTECKFDVQGWDDRKLNLQG